MPLPVPTVPACDGKHEPHKVIAEGHLRFGFPKKDAYSPTSFTKSHLTSEVQKFFFLRIDIQFDPLCFDIS
jgi:hypothetical protein